MSIQHSIMGLHYHQCPGAPDYHGGTEALGSSSMRPMFHHSLRQQQQQHARPQFRPFKNSWHATLLVRDLVSGCVTRF